MFFKIPLQLGIVKGSTLYLIYYVLVLLLQKRTSYCALTKRYKKIHLLTSPYSNFHGIWLIKPQRKFLSLRLQKSFHLAVEAEQLKFHLPASSRPSSYHSSDFGNNSNREINAGFITFSASAQDSKGFLQHYYSVSLLQPGKNISRCSYQHIHTEGKRNSPGEW